jgi:hypothetical protein
MSLHANMVTPRTSKSSLPSLLEGVLVTSTTAVVIGFGALALYAFNRGVVPAVLVLTLTAGMGLITGWTARFELTGRSALVRWWVAMFGLCVGMIPQGWLSSGVLGFDPIKLDLIAPDLEGLLRLSVGALTAWLAVRAWSERPDVHGYPLPAGPIVEDLSIARDSGRSNSTGGVERSSGVSLSPPTRRPRRSLSLHRSNSSHAARSLRRPVFGQEASRKRIARHNRRQRIHNAIHLMEKIEHRCPFCLEIVEPNDPRGSVECTICHTLHHADCWAVTETCQVPHHKA